MRKRKNIDKKIAKLSAKKCRICGENDYNILDCHRILPGSKNGTYKNSNTVIVCSNCHRKIHAGGIEVDRYYPTTTGRLLRVIIDDKEDFI